MSRRPVNPARRYGDSGGRVIFPSSKSRASPYLSIGLTIMGALLLMVLFVQWLSIKDPVSGVEGDFSCTVDLQRAIPILKKAYGDKMQNVLHVGRDTCSVVSRLLKEDETEAWGVEPYDIEDADGNCK